MTKSYRRVGIGQALMQAAEDWAREHGATSLELSVHEFNFQAILFYRKRGFLPIRIKWSGDLVEAIVFPTGRIWILA